MNSLSSSASEDVVLRQLLEYCSDQNIYISPSIAPRRFPGRGLGVYATRSIRRGQKLMHVPTPALLTTASVPKNFADKSKRKDLSVHGLLAAYLAFGLPPGSGNKYKRWMATWPSLSDFTTTMPMFWPKQAHGSNDLPRRSFEEEKRPLKVRRTLPNHKPKVEDNRFSCTSPAISEHWATVSSSATITEVKPGGLVQQQLDKLDQCIDAVARLLPDIADDLRSPLHVTHWKFVHMWCCVNTRCFYYVKPGEKHPEDSNEAMALCPGMDLFNHTDEEGCTTKYDKGGYHLMSDRDYDAGMEILLSYGGHNNDVLWSEYGFMLDRNLEDGIRIDAVVLQNITAPQRLTLGSAGYLGEYWLRCNGVCWRTEVVAWMHTLKTKQWQKMVAGSWTPEKVVPGLQRTNAETPGRNQVVIRADASTTWAKRKIVDWTLQVRQEAENALLRMLEMKEDEVVEFLAEDPLILKAQGEDLGNVQILRRKRALQRHGVCIQRWKQIWQICTSTIRSVEAECESAFITNAKGRKAEDLSAEIDHFLNSVQKQ